MAKVLTLPSGRVAEILRAYFHGLSPNTASGYGIAWAKFSAVHPDIAKVRETDAWEYAQSLVAQGLAASTVNTRLFSLRAIIDHLVAFRALPENPFRFGPVAKFKAKGPPVRQPPAIDAETVAKLLEVPSAFTRLGIRDRAILALLFGAGLRRSEVLDLRISYLTFGTGLRMVLPMTKAGKPQRRLAPPWAAEAMRKWLAVRGRCSTDHVFTTHKGTALTVSGLVSLWKAHCARLGKNYPIHATRVTAITRLLTKGKTLHEVKDFAGHASTQMAERYFRFYVEDDDHAAMDLKY